MTRWRAWEGAVSDFIAPRERTVERLKRVHNAVELAIHDVFPEALLRPIGSYATGSLLRGHRDFDAAILFKEAADLFEPEMKVRRSLDELSRLLGPATIRENRVGGHAVFNFVVMSTQVSLGATVATERPRDCFEEIPLHPNFVNRAGNTSHIAASRLMKAALRHANARRAFCGFAIERMVLWEPDPEALSFKIGFSRVCLPPITASPVQCDPPNRRLRVSYLFHPDDLLEKVKCEELAAFSAVARELYRFGAAALLPTWYSLDINDD